MKERKSRKISCIVIYVFICVAMYIFLYQFTHPNSTEQTAMKYALANFYSISIGAYTIGFLIVSGLFLLSFSMHKAEWSLLLLMLSYGFSMFNTLNIQSGRYFLSSWLYETLSWDGFMFIPSHTILLFLLLKQDKKFWQYFIRILKLLFLAQIVAYLISLCFDGYFSSMINAYVNSFLVSHNFAVILFWITNLLLFSCTGITVYCFIKDTNYAQLQENVMQIKTDMTMESYETLKDFMSNGLLFYQQLHQHVDTIKGYLERGQYSEIESLVNKFNDDIKTVKDFTFCENQSINFLLVAYAFQSHKYETNYLIDASLPNDLSEYESDLCSFLLNLLNTAMEANRMILPANERFIRLTVRYENGFLSIYSEHPYHTELQTDTTGNLLSTKFQRDDLRFEEMKSIAKKYNSSLSVHLSNHMLTLQTTLKFK